jgi:large subunit ribosomal protein L12
MEYVYAALILNESGAEINEENVTDVLDAAGVDVEESRVKALIAALEDVDIDEAVAEAAVPAAGGAGAAPAEGGEEAAEAEEEEEAEEELPETADEEEGEEEEEASGEGLGDLFG